MKLPKQATVTMYVHIYSGQFVLFNSNMESDFYTCLGPAEITFDVPQKTHDEIVALRVDSLKEQKHKIMGEMQHKIDQIDDKINSLLALEAPKEVE